MTANRNDHKLIRTVNSSISVPWAHGSSSAPLCYGPFPPAVRGVRMLQEEGSLR